MYRAAGLLIWIMVAVLAAEVFGRIRFPYDLYFASESPFMTNMLKLDAGEPLFTAVEQMNSHIYAPGMEALFWAIAKPLGLVHDVRAARLLVVALGALAALTVGRVISAETNTHTSIYSGITLLILFKNFTADLVHPDNFHVLHTVVTLALALAAHRQRSFRWAMIAVLWAGLGVWTKQTAVLTVVGVLVGFAWIAWFQEDDYPRSDTKEDEDQRRRVDDSVGLILLAGGGVATVVASVAGLWGIEFGRFYTYELSLMHDIFPKKLLDLPRLWLVMPHKLILLGLLPIALRRLWMQPARRPFLILWTTIGIFGTGASLIAYLKAFGTWNNLGIFDVWMTMPVLIMIATEMERLAIVQTHWRWVGVFALLTLFPLRMPPPPSYYAWASAWEGLISADLHANRRILLANGTTLLTRSGSYDVPLDRAAAATDLKGANLMPTATHQRLADQQYDRIYLNVPNWYADQTLRLMADHYKRVDTLPAPSPAYRYLFGYQKELFETVLILEPR